MAHAGLRSAQRALASCAKAVAASAPNSLTPRHAELQIGVGTAAEWVAWASQLRSLDFSSSIKRSSPRSISYLESTRFTFAWTAANALFSRNVVLGHLTKKIPTREIERFGVLYNTANLTPAEKTSYLSVLHNTLGLVRVPDAFPWATLPQIRIIDLIYHKYTPDPYKAKGDAGRLVRDIVTGSQPITSLELPSIIYLTRNWTLHGALLNSSFRGSPKQFQRYITTITEVMALVLERSATELEKRI